MSKQIRVATYNVGDFSGVDMKQGSNKSRTAFFEVFKKINADVWALQEDVEYFDEDAKELAVDAIYKKILPYYARNYTRRYNGKAFLSRFKVTDAEAVDYKGDVRFRHPWYYKGKINIDCKKITLICLHFDWSDKFVRAEQIKQVIEFAKTQEYCIIMGDFNPEDYIDGEKQSPEIFYKEELAKFTQEGFETANAGKFGIFDTIVNSNHHGFATPFDNIIVTSNIKILSAERCYEPWMNDHALVYADIEIC